MADLLPPVMTETEAELCVDRINAGVLQLSELIYDLHERRGWEVLGYSSMSECVKQRLKIGKSRAYQLLNYEYISRELSTMVDSPINERQARELAKAPEGKRAAALAKAKETAAAQGRATPTAKDIREAVELGSGTEPQHDATHQDDAEPRMAVTDGDQLQQGDNDDGRGSDRHSTSGATRLDSLCGIRAGQDEDYRACPHGGTHRPATEAGETYCKKCFEPLDESEAEDTYDTTSLDEFCRWTIDQCEPQHREQLAARLAHWAKEAKGTK